MMHFKQSSVLFAALTFASSLGAAVLAADPADDGNGFFERKIRPLLVAHCHECHSANAKTLQGGLRLDDPAGLDAGGDSGLVVVPGKPEESLLIEAVGYRNVALQMPPAGKLVQQELDDLAAWVAMGAPFPGAAPAVIAAGRTIDFEEGRRFWSFRPLARIEPPAAGDAAWCRRRIDRFLLAELEKHALRPSAAADRRTLIRRATFDLTGLPPAPEEVEAFVADADDGAYVRLVERLLASPRYGERWGRFWLDMARYCDVPEPWAQTTAQAWLYRDWVVKAFNDDLPYDQFVVRQLAADLLPEACLDEIAALGFLGLSPTYWKELKLDPGVIKTVVAEEWEERIDAVASTLLGLTVGCARCHDHKFDPVGTADYYALAGVFASTRQTPRPLLPPAEAQEVTSAREQVQALDERMQKLLAQQPATDESKQMAEELKAEILQIKERTVHFDAPLAYAVDDASLLVLADGAAATKLEYRPGEAQDVAIQLRGNPAKTGAVAPRRFLTVLSADTPAPFKQGSGRLELARAIVGDAQPLAARVIVNRVWRLHFGRGLVDTPSNFGAQGARPTHPELLDDLAFRFIAAGWSFKWLHREIMLSNAYRQASGFDADKYAVDPDNRLLWRMNRRRLEVEAWRDAMLAATGSLDGRLGGAAQELAAADNRRRTLYGLVKRRELDDLLRLYDVPDATVHSPGRVPTTTPLQQLFVLNSGFMAREAAALAERLQSESSDDAQRIQQAYQLLFGRPATDAQVRAALDFLAGGSEAAARDDLWRQYAQVLLGSNELMFVD
ncbi:MAG TPA: PSD1 and planctomycete cytochrome C domain-containing protein [Pirellulales bacterium]|nr:PSD1 and planctomycete cytochrome C domain-containing protein [Pirellulales bacterium]